MAVFSGAEIVDSGLVLHLDAANSKSYSGSGTTWYDLSGNNRSGTLFNGTSYNNSNNGNIVFDGVDDYVIVDNWGILTGNASYTYDLFFIKRNDTNSNWISYGTGSTSSMNQVGVYNGTIGALNYSNDTTISASLVSSNEWHSISVTHNGTTTTVFIDGEQVAQKNTTYTFGSSNLNIGRAAITGYHASISLSAVKIYNRALSVAELKQNFEATRGRYGI